MVVGEGGLNFLLFNKLKINFLGFFFYFLVYKGVMMFWFELCLKEKNICRKKIRKYKNILRDGKFFKNNKMYSVSVKFLRISKSFSLLIKKLLNLYKKQNLFWCFKR